MNKKKKIRIISLAVITAICTIGGTLFAFNATDIKTANIIQPLIEAKILEGNTTMSVNQGSMSAITADLDFYSNVSEKKSDILVDIKSGFGITMNGNIKLDDEHMYISSSLLSLTNTETIDDASEYAVLPIESLLQLAAQTGGLNIGESPIVTSDINAPDKSDTTQAIKDAKKIKKILMKNVKITPQISKDTIIITLNKSQYIELFGTLSTNIENNLEELQQLLPNANLSTDTVETLKQMNQMIQTNMHSLDLHVEIKRIKAQTQVISSIELTTSTDANAKVTLTLNSSDTINSEKETTPTNIKKI